MLCHLMLKNIEKNWKNLWQIVWSSSVLIKTWKQECSCRYYFIPLELKKMMHWFYLRQDVAILFWQILILSETRPNQQISPRFYQDCLYVIGNRNQIEIKVWCQFNESSIRVFAQSSQQRAECFLSTLQNMGVEF